MNTVIFACVHNAGRSQMAAAWFNRLADGRKACALSAGTHPADALHPVVVEAMDEVGGEVRAMRDDIRRRVMDLLQREGWRGDGVTAR